jgi:hypothetical protein
MLMYLTRLMRVHVELRGRLLIDVADADVCWPGLLLPSDVRLASRSNVATA